MSDDDLDLLLDSDKPAFSGKRPMFLQVLCILTFVGAGLGIAQSLFTIFIVGAFDNAMNTLADLDSGPFVDEFQNSYRWTKISYILNLVGSLLCLAGALIMWRLRKYGYFIYVLGQLLPLIGSFMVMNAFSTGFLGGLGFIGLALGAIFPIGFIIMYGLNLKHMR